MRILFGSLVLVSLGATLASAQTAPLPPPPPPIPPPPGEAAPPPIEAAPPPVEAAPPRGVHLHDGFYLRVGLGFGSYSESIKQQDASDESRVSGLASVGEFAIGGTIRPGLILGGGAWTSSLMASDRTIRGPMPPPEIIDTQADYTLVGPFLDYYFDPAKGAHMQAALGFATVRSYSLDTDSVNSDRTTFGGGAMFGFGYEWWVSDQWSLGILGRLTLVVATTTDDSNVRWFHTIGSLPCVLFTATYN